MSDATVCENGGETYNEEFIESVRTGDVILFDRKCGAMGSPLGISVCLFAKWTSKYDHVGVVVRPSKADEPQVLEAGFRGVTLRPLRQRLDREHHNAAAVRHLLLNDDGAGSSAAAIRARIEDYARSVDGAPYKRRLSDFLTGAAQPPEKREALEVAAALNASLRQDAALRKLLASGAAAAKSGDTKKGKAADAPTLPPTAARRAETLRYESDILQTAAMQHADRVRRDLPRFVVGDDASGTDPKEAGQAGMFCSELVSAALQRAHVQSTFPGATNFGAHDFSALAAATTADDVRLRRPPPLAPEACLGPELLLKRRDDTRELRKAAPPDRRDLVACLEGLGWAFTAATQAAPVWRPVFVQRGDAIELGTLSAPSTAMIPTSTRMYIATRPPPPATTGAAPAATATAADSHELRCELVLPPFSPFGADVVDLASAAHAAGGWNRDPAFARRSAVAIAENDGFVWVADTAEVQRVQREAPALAGEAAAGDVDPTRVRLRRAAGTRHWGGEKELQPYALYVVETGAVHDATVDRVYRQGEIVGLDTFLAHLPAEAEQHNGWDGHVLSGRQMAPPKPLALRNGTVLRLVTYAEVLATGVLPSDPHATSDKRAGGGSGDAPLTLRELRRRYAVFMAHTDGRVHDHNRKLRGVPHMDAARRRHYFDLDGVPMLPARLLELTLQQNRPDPETVLYSDVQRIELACRSAAALVDPAKPRSRTLAAAFFLATQSSGDGKSATVTGVNELLHRLYQSRPDAPYLSISAAEKAATGNLTMDLYRSDANIAGRQMIFAEFLQRVEDGSVLVPAAVVADTLLLINHVNVQCNGAPSVFDMNTYRTTRTAEEEAELSERPERFLDAELTKMVQGTAWDFSQRQDAVSFLKRYAAVVAAGIVCGAFVFPMQVAVWHRQLYGRTSQFTRAYLMTARGYSGALFHQAHALFVRRAAVGMGILTAGVMGGARPAAPMYDPELDDVLPPHPHWQAFRYGVGATAAVGMITYPLEVALAHSVANMATMQQGDAIVNYYASQSAPRSTLRRIFDAHGVRGLFRGAHLSLVSLTPFFGVHWLWYHELMVGGFMDRRFAPSAVFGPAPTVDEYFATSCPTAWYWKPGLVAAAYTAHAVVAHPVETVRQVAMARQLPAHQAAAALLKSSDSNPVRFVRRLYAGFGVHLARTGPVFLASYTLTGALITDYKVSAPRQLKEAARKLNNRSLNPIHQYKEIS